MNTLDLRTASLDEMVFEGRNKMYGAYVLRRLYQRHLARALAIAVSLTLLLVSSPLVKAWLFPTLIEAAPIIPELPSIDLIRPPLLADPKPAGSQVQPAHAVVRPPAEIAPRVVPDNQAKPDVLPDKPTVTEAVVAEVDSPPGVIGSSTGKVGDAGTGVGKSDSGTAKAPAAPAPFITAEVMPEFMGGQEALQRYMQKNLHYPPLALRNNVAGRVYISFTVQADGSIADVQVLKGLGYGTDEEAARVVKNMPLWSPGKQNKHSVAVRYTMPITFRYE
ncbi:TonB family protein [Hymenobacter tibetensis]|uniref:TonB family protein n=1 Tax=Hymenobacter tibetensis TaxID=497967 RepID=A0ABY4CYV9_9BACT|nr:energy transducer TonB [Hymenobacter tibetensis]UOG75454.1 TonB family protein [Hymenobacter tibetensis]